MRVRVLAMMMAVLCGSAAAQPRSPSSPSRQAACIGPEKLAVQAAQTRPGSGGTWNYTARIANYSMQPIRFDLRFVMHNAQPNRDIFSTQSLGGRTYREYVLANGLSVSDATRIIEGIRLTCR
ncbi:hypothetical protein [Roseococcus sp. YIM B11640]|uniref:hypothetical protein n=1 Tax=Roseococcus sp. YIM B11640 TaxID=3133973 RepID=UPI003C7D5A80